MEWCDRCCDETRHVRYTPDFFECIRCRDREERRREPRQYVFIGYSLEELAATPGYEPVFRPGDLLAEDVEASKGASDDIPVVRLEDGVRDSVWPEEVRRLT